MLLATFDFFDTYLNVTNDLLELIGSLLKSMNTSDAVYGIDYLAFSTLYQPIFQAFAYAFCLLFIGINIMESTIQYELFTLKGAMKIVARILIIKIFIDASSVICVYIIDIGVELTKQIIEKAGENSIAFPAANLSDSLPVSNIPFIGDLIDLVLAIIALVPFLIMVLIVAVISFCVIIKLVLRTFELAMLISISPIFFACWVGDTTKQYFKKFITTFTGVVMQVVFMALVYAITLSWLRQNSSTINGGNVGEWFASAVPSLVTLIAMGIMMIKPPKILTSLIS